MSAIASASSWSCGDVERRGRGALEDRPEVDPQIVAEARRGSRARRGAARPARSRRPGRRRRAAARRPESWSTRPSRGPRGSPSRARDAPRTRLPRHPCPGREGRTRRSRRPRGAGRGRSSGRRGRPAAVRRKRGHVAAADDDGPVESAGAPGDDAEKRRPPQPDGPISAMISPRPPVIETSATPRPPRIPLREVPRSRASSLHLLLEAAHPTGISR